MAMPHRSTTPPATIFPMFAAQKALHDARALIAVHGVLASSAASARSTEARAKDNAWTFAHWRQVERLVCLLQGKDAAPTVH